MSKASARTLIFVFWLRVLVSGLFIFGGLYTALFHLLFWLTVALVWFGAVIFPGKDDLP